jgi:hypothetical protein
MDHYCVDCEAGDDHEEEDFCCGGDGSCEAQEVEPDCIPGKSHEWTGEGMGGLDSNPGVWSLGGTTILERMKCDVCGIIRKIIVYGSQRNPGTCDSVSYEAEDESDDD